jgi:hypothetical protein
MILPEARRHGIGPGWFAVALAATLAISCGGGGSSHPDAGQSRPDSGARDRASATDRGADLGGDALGDGAGDATGTGGGAGAGADADANANADGGAGCTLPPLGGDLNRQWDLHLAVVSGTLTLTGAPLPDSPALTTRGNLVFRERSTGDVRALPIGGAGAASFSGSLFAGSYDVSFETAPGAALVGLPVAAKTRVASTVTLAGNRQLDYDLKLVTVSGTITSGTAALPDSPTLTSRGNVVFRERQSGDVRSLSVGATGPGAFSGSLFAGTYDVSFETVSSASLAGLPISAEIRVATALALTGDATALAYDVQVASVAGKIIAGGAALPDSPTLTTRGNLVFREQQSGDVRTFAVPATGLGTYGGSLFAGTYDVSFQTPAGTGLVGLPASSTTRLATGVVVQGAAPLGYDLPVATIAGTVTAGGAALPDSPTVTTRGMVRFAERTTGLTNSFPIGATGAATFGGLLFAGTYDVTFVSSAAAGLVGLPAGGGKRVESGLAIAAGAATLAYDLPITAISGTITAGGAALPDSPALTNRGNVVFRDRETGVATSLPVGATGPGLFAGGLFASSYDVTFETVNSANLIGLPVAAETRLASNLAIAAATTGTPPLTWDTRVVTVAGRLTLDGAALPDSPALATRGNVVLREKLTGDIRALPLAATGAGTVSAIAFAGSYDVALETTAAAGLVGLPLAAETTLDVGCLPGGSCAADPGDVSGLWTFIFRDQVSWIRWNVSLTQTGGALGGQFTAASGYAGRFDSGNLAGNAVTLSSMQNSSTCVLRVDATLSGGCFMAGIGSCASGASQSPFVGLR